MEAYHNQQQIKFDFDIFHETTANTTFANSILCIQAIDEVEVGQSGCALRRQIRSQLEGRHYFDQIRT